MENVLCPIQKNAHLTPDYPAVITTQKTWTYRELDCNIQAVCQFLEDIGVTENQRVAFVARNDLATILFLFSLFRLHAIACPLSTRLPKEKLIASVDLLKTPYLLEPYLPTKDRVREETKDACIPFHHPTTFLFTSGSCGVPKIVCHSFANHYYNAMGAVDPLNLHSSSRWLLSLPLFHVSGIGILFRCFIRQAAVVLSDLPLYESTEKFQITHLSFVPTQLIRLLREPQAILDTIKRSLVCLLLGGAPLPSFLLEEANRYALPLFTTYGMTEMGSMITLSEKNPSNHSGIVLPFREIKLENHEILVRGKTLFIGYWDPCCERVLPNKEPWFATKDLGRFTSKGHLEVIGRKDRQFISGGENIQPEEIEQALLTLPGIRQAIVLPIADQEFGHRPVAFLDDETKQYTLDGIREKLKTVLPSFKHPIRIFPYPCESGIKPNVMMLKQSLESFQECRVEKEE